MTRDEAIRHLSTLAITHPHLNLGAALDALAPTDPPGCLWMINDARLTVRTANLLWHNGLRTREAVLAASDLDLVRIRGFGRGRLAELRAKGLRP
jgi:DNA-directed RNA polymerase alpha subunit